MPLEHMIFEEQVAWQTWITPTKGLYLLSASLDPGSEYVEQRITGVGRAVKNSWLGKKLPTGQLTLPLYYEYMGFLLKAAGLHDIDSTQQGATAAYAHGFIPKDDTVPSGLSVQLKRDADDASNIQGVMFDSMTLAFAAGEPAELRGNFIAYDEANTGDTWENTDAAPAVIASPTYFADTVLPFRFQHATINIGSTLTWVAGENVFTKVGGSAATIENFEVTWENGWDPRVFLGDRLAGNVIGQEFNVTGRFDVDQSTVDETFYAYYRDGTQKAVWLEVDSGVEADTGYNYLMRIVIPLCDFRQGALPDISGDQSRRMQTVEFTGVLGADDVPFQITIVDTESSY